MQLHTQMFRETDFVPTDFVEEWYLFIKSLFIVSGFPKICTHTFEILTMPLYNVEHRSYKTIHPHCKISMHRNQSLFLKLDDTRNCQILRSMMYLYNRLAQIIHPDSYLSSIALLWQTLSLIKVVIFHQKSLEKSKSLVSVLSRVSVGNQRMPSSNLTSCILFLSNLWFK